jgi:hypothetical protein
MVAYFILGRAALKDEASGGRDGQEGEKGLATEAQRTLRIEGNRGRNREGKHPDQKRRDTQSKQE